MTCPAFNPSKDIVRNQDSIPGDRAALGKTHTRATPPVSVPSKLLSKHYQCLIESRSFTTTGRETVSILHSCLVPAICDGILGFVRAQTVPHTSKHLCAGEVGTVCEDRNNMNNKVKQFVTVNVIIMAPSSPSPPSAHPLIVTLVRSKIVTDVL